MADWGRPYRQLEAVCGRCELSPASASSNAAQSPIADTTRSSPTRVPLSAGHSAVSSSTLSTSSRSTGKNPHASYCLSRVSSRKTPSSPRRAARAARHTRLSLSSSRPFSTLFSCSRQHHARRSTTDQSSPSSAKSVPTPLLRQSDGLCGSCMAYWERTRWMWRLRGG